MRYEKNLLFYTSSRSGHRGEYADLMSSLLSGEVTESRKGLILEKRTVFYLMVEDNFSSYVYTSIFRQLRGRKTIGLLFRPKPALERRSLRHKIKWLALRSLKRMSGVKTISIIPFYALEHLEDIADAWIYDAQFWDLTESKLGGNFSQIGGELSDKISAASAGRAIITAIGAQNEEKGFDKFVNFYTLEKSNHQNFFFAFGGRVAQNVANYESLFEKFGFSINRFINNDEVLQLYAISDAVWCFYSEKYDQASGIAGRAIQLGVPPIVRADSVMHKICEVEKVPHVALAASDRTLPRVLPPRYEEKGQVIASSMRIYSLNVIENFLKDGSR